ncbi:MAG: sodium:alanine symporter family protein [Eubacterium aggregans]|uniref:Alanine or glycine:cation symporter, AGCS family n=1 Tax=Eubacterium aggregans TaxID=81409 RepID=A0A1H3Y5C1_9FIRM|nr:sodium:alanine symporter family protein [Eubacterium aggregans]MDD4691930.1 sodium:alanine symporter family protein [Eubacterium aggregans]MEA5073012.1 sodium:alanine symporter family protein [Eubacterium aggregans]SEA06876.1 alanine or glycine:cation symporter, AGCS family [Eubacterium aggregans]
MFQIINNFLLWFDDLVWGVPLIVLILAVGIYLTIRLKVLQIRHLPKALKFMVKNEDEGSGEVSSFGALCTALSATIGTGNIVGVATAIVAGGPGALFWMWLAAFFGMATKYAEGVLAIKYRTIDDNGHVLGGPFYYIERGMGPKWRWMGKIFAFFGAGVGLLGIGTFTQVNGIASAVNGFFDPNNAWTVNLLGTDYSWTVVITGIILTLCVGLVVIGGIKRIARVSEVIVPFMAVAYILCCLVILIVNFSRIPAAFAEIIQSAFGLRAVTGGAMGAIIVAMQKGIARGIFSNEAGLGSAPIAAAAAQTKTTVRQGLVSMTGTFIDTIIICTMTGLAIVLTESWNIGLEGVAVTTNAFQQGLPFNPSISAFLLMLCLVFFAFTTILGWNYYGERCLEYLSNGRKSAVQVYRWLYILAIFIGPFMTVQAVWTIADIFNALMALPNLIALMALSGVVVSETKKYFEDPASALIHSKDMVYAEEEL